jgi:hypothetical protein
MMVLVLRKWGESLGGGIKIVGSKKLVNTCFSYAYFLEALELFFFSVRNNF